MKHLRRFEMERYLTNDLGADERRDIDAHLASCASCRATTEETRARFEAWSAGRSALRLAQAEIGTAPTQQTPASLPGWRRWRRSAAIVASALAVAAAFAVAVVAPAGEHGDSPAGERLKGIVVAIHVLRDGGARPLGIDERVRDGDRIRFEITSDRDAHVVVLAASAEGEAELWYPDVEEELPAVRHAVPTLLPGSIELSAMRERQELYVLLVEPPIDRESLVRAAREAASRGATELDVPAVGHWHRTLVPEAAPP